MSANEYQADLTFINGDIASKLFDREGEAIEWARGTTSRVETCWDLFGDRIREARSLIIMP